MCTVHTQLYKQREGAKSWGGKRKSRQSVGGDYCIPWHDLGLRSGAGILSRLCRGESRSFAVECDQPGGGAHITRVYTSSLHRWHESIRPTKYFMCENGEHGEILGASFQQTSQVCRRIQLNISVSVGNLGQRLHSSNRSKAKEALAGSAACAHVHARITTYVHGTHTIHTIVVC